MKNIDYIQNSLELHLFFDRIMKEHSFFLEIAFPEKERKWKDVAKNFQNAFSNILNQIIILSSGNISSNLLTSEEIVTKNTLQAEIKSSYLTGNTIDTNLTVKELNLKSGRIQNSSELIYQIEQINRQTLPLIQNLIDFKTDILNQVQTCQMFTLNYPLLISHILNEAKMYHFLLSQIEQGKMSMNKQEQNLFWNNIMKEHAEFIRGLLDPTEKELIKTADQFASQYAEIIEKYRFNSLSQISLNETIQFQKFKVAGEEGILNCQIKSIIVPLLADHVVREANHFIRLLQNNA